MDNQLNLFEQPKQAKPQGEFVHVTDLCVPGTARVLKSELSVMCFQTLGKS